MILTVMHDDPLCPHGVPGWTACDTCLAELVEDEPTPAPAPVQEDTPLPPIQRYPDNL